MTQQCNHQTVSSLRQRAQQSAILCDRQRLRAPRPAPHPHPPAQQCALKELGSEKKAQSNGGWRREAGGERRRIPLRSKANQYWPPPGRFKSLSTIPAPLSVVNKRQESCLVLSLGRSIVSSGEESLGEVSFSLQGGLSVGQLPLGVWGHQSISRTRPGIFIPQPWEGPRRSPRGPSLPFHRQGHQDL